ncbi:MAG: hypothetical protein VSS75_014660 [Candidatus Parabeggiatoa sp.]|nr:hypothetical protein [Candidatus Parabeggiatoa sp.]
MMTMLNCLTNFVKITLCLVSLLLFSCYNNVTVDSLVGVYTANHGKELDVLKINSDGTYEHLYTEKNKNTQVNKNRWSFEIVDNKVEGITFTDFHVYFKGKKSGGYWYREIEYDLFGNIRFCLDPDLYYYYVKNTSADKN